MAAQGSGKVPEGYERARRKNPAHVSLFVRSVPRALRNAFKAWCELHERPMNEVLCEFMRKTIKEQ